MLKLWNILAVIAAALVVTSSVALAVDVNEYNRVVDRCNNLVDQVNGCTMVIAILAVLMIVFAVLWFRNKPKEKMPAAAGTAPKKAKKSKPTCECGKPDAKGGQAPQAGAGATGQGSKPAKQPKTDAKTGDGKSESKGGQAPQAGKDKPGDAGKANADGNAGGGTPGAGSSGASILLILGMLAGLLFGAAGCADKEVRKTETNANTASGTTLKTRTPEYIRNLTSIREMESNSLTGPELVSSTGELIGAYAYTFSNEPNGLNQKVYETVVDMCKAYSGNNRAQLFGGIRAKLLPDIDAHEADIQKILDQMVKALGCETEFKALMAELDCDDRTARRSVTPSTRPSVAPALGSRNNALRGIFILLGYSPERIDAEMAKAASRAATQPAPQSTPPVQVTPPTRSGGARKGR